MKMRVKLPEHANLERFNDKDLQKLVDLIYHPVSGRFYRTRFDMIVRFLKERYRNVLEIGCGPGLMLLELSRRSDRVYGADFHTELEKVKGMLRKEKVDNCSLLKADIYKLPFKKSSFEAVVCMSLLEHLKDLTLAIEKINYVLKEKGEMIIGFPVKNIITKKLFSLLGYNDEVIHPQGHNQILEACSKFLVAESILSYPRFCSLNYALYAVIKFRKARND